MKTLKELLEKSMQEVIMFDEDFPIQTKITEDKSPKMFAIIGDNASGKSFVTTNFLGMANRLYNIKGYHIGMKNRTAGGMESVFIYGEEGIQSTGATTLNAVIGGLKNIKNHILKNQKMLLILDEPTIGLSLGYEKAMGKYIAEVFNEIKDLECFIGVMIVSHSKIMFEEIQNSGIEFSVMAVDHDLTFKQWCEKEEDYSIEELLLLSEKGLSKYKEIDDYIKNLKK